MKNIGVLNTLGFHPTKEYFWNFPVSKLVLHTLQKEHQLNVRVITETPWQSLFANNLFLGPTEKELETFEHE